MDRFLIHKNPLAGLKLGLPALLFGVAMCFTQVVLADAACDAEIAAIQSALDTPSASISSDNLQQAQQLFKVLTADCGDFGITRRISQNYLSETHSYPE